MSEETTMDAKGEPVSNDVVTRCETCGHLTDGHNGSGCRYVGCQCSLTSIYIHRMESLQSELDHVIEDRDHWRANHDRQVEWKRVGHETQAAVIAELRRALQEQADEAAGLRAALEKIKAAGEDEEGNELELEPPDMYDWPAAIDYNVTATLREHRRIAVAALNPQPHPTTYQEKMNELAFMPIPLQPHHEGGEG